MTDIEHLFLENMEEEKFHDVVNDDFEFVDSLIDQTDLDKIEDIKEEE